jgi:hypothetical protein
MSLTITGVRRRVRQIQRWAEKPELHYRAENAERDLADDFVRWCARDIAANDPREVRAIAAEIAKVYDCDFNRHYAEEEY